MFPMFSWFSNTSVSYRQALQKWCTKLMPSWSAIFLSLEKYRYFLIFSLFFTSILYFVETSASPLWQVCFSLSTIIISGLLAWIVSSLWISVWRGDLVFILSYSTCCTQHDQNYAGKLMRPTLHCNYNCILSQTVCLMWLLWDWRSHLSHFAINNG